MRSLDAFFYIKILKRRACGRKRRAWHVCPFNTGSRLSFWFTRLEWKTWVKLCWLIMWFWQESNYCSFLCRPTAKKYASDNGHMHNRARIQFHCRAHIKLTCVCTLRYGRVAYDVGSSPMSTQCGNWNEYAKIKQKDKNEDFFPCIVSLYLAKCEAFLHSVKLIMNCCVIRFRNIKIWLWISTL